MTTFATVAALVAAINGTPTGTPRTLLLASGSYGAITLKCADLTDRAITIEPEDPANPPVVAGVELDSCNGLTFKGLDWTINARLQTIGNVLRSRNVYIIGGKMHDAPGSTRAGVLLRWCSYCGVSGTELFNLGTAVRVLQSDHITVARSALHDLTVDGVQFSASNYVTIDANTFTDFFPLPGTHADAVQGLTLGQTAPSTDFTITNNVYTRGKGLPTQGVFMGDEANVGYQRVTITGNIINGAMYRGISPAKSDGPVIKNNTVQAWADVGSGIYLDYSTNVVASGNRASSYSPASLATGNVTLKPVPVGDTSILNPPVSPPPPPPPVSPPPPPPPPVVVDPKDTEIAALTAQLATANAAITKLSDDLTLAVSAGSALAAERDALRVQVAAVTAERDALAAKVSERQGLLDQIRGLASQ